jgi:hypothetical protein
MLAALLGGCSRDSTAFPTSSLMKSSATEQPSTQAQCPDSQRHVFFPI